MLSRGAFGVGAVVGGLLVAVGWMLAIQCSPTAGTAPQPLDVALLRSELSDLRDEVHRLQQSAQGSPLDAAQISNRFEAVRETTASPPLSTSTSDPNLTTAETRDLIALLWRCLRDDEDGIVAALDERQLSPADPIVARLVNDVFSRLDDLRRRVPVNVTATRKDRELADRFEEALKDDSRSQKDRDGMTRDLDRIRGRLLEQEPMAHQFKTEYEAIIRDFLEKLPTKEDR